MPLEVSPIYKKWLFLLPWDKGNNSPCPSCDSNAIEYCVIGNQERNFGWALIWCNACGCGIHISRMQLPANAKILSFVRKSFTSTVQFHGVDKLEQVIPGKVNVLNLWREGVDINLGTNDPKIGEYAMAIECYRIIGTLNDTVLTKDKMIRYFEKCLDIAKLMDPSVREQSSLRFVASMLILKYESDHSKKTILDNEMKTYFGDDWRVSVERPKAG